MRVSLPTTTDGFAVKAISGTHTILIALNCLEPRRRGLRGFAFERRKEGESRMTWLNAQKVFRSVVPDPASERDPRDPTQPRRYQTNEHPIQSFLWGDYTADADTRYEFNVVPMYGLPGALEPATPLTFAIRTEKEFDGKHGVWFNRGAIASQAFARKFQNKALTEAEQNDPNQAETKWLSRGLLEACLDYIRRTPDRHGLRVAAYEFTYAPILDALKAALDRGVDVRIVYHGKTTAASEEKAANERAIARAGLPKKVGGTQILFPRRKTKIPHNKFIVRLDQEGKPYEVWTGSTNFTPSGFLGQTNVAHRVLDQETARQYLDFWSVLKTDPTLEAARKKTLALTPHPKDVIDVQSIVRVFSPRSTSKLLNWYADRTLSAANSVMFTAAFGIAKQLIPSIAKAREIMRFVLLEKPTTTAAKAVLTKDRNRVILSYGVPLGELYQMKNGTPTSRKRIQEFELDKWYLKEEHFRKANEGFVFFVHTKFLLIDPLSDDPLVCSGSANFSSNSLLQNDENMLLIRGDTRVADIYLTEFDRVFRHFYFRDVANELAAKGSKSKAAFLDETDKWTDSYFKPGALKTLRREMFFAVPKTTWFAGTTSPKKPSRAIQGKALGSKVRKTDRSRPRPQ